MIPNVVRGDRAQGLLAYLVGPGRANEHTEPTLIASDDPLAMVIHGDTELGRSAAAELARYIEQPHRALGVDVNGGHIWHCSLSLSAEEGQLSDEKWGEIARDFVTAMGFDDHEGTKAACRWVAIRHGVSKNGNDHIHLAVDLVREDGTNAWIHNDFQRAQQASRAIEVAHGLEELGSDKAARATRGYDPAEREAQARARAAGRYGREVEAARRAEPSWLALTPAQRRSQARAAWDSLPLDEQRSRVRAELRTDQPRYVLALNVRAAAAASNDEAEFVRRLRRQDLIVRPRYAQGTTDVVAGYSVAERPTQGERPIWYGGGNLGRDLTLPRLRSEWPDSVESSTAANAEWAAAMRGRRVVSVGREASTPSPADWQRSASDLEQLVQKLRAVPVDDRETWVQVARETSGALAAWSRRVEQTPGDLGNAAHVLSASAQTYRAPQKPPRRTGNVLSGVAFLAASATHGGQGAVAQAAMVQSLLRLAQSIHRSADAARDTRQARAIATDVRARLSRVHEGLRRMPEVATPPRAERVEGPPLDAETQAMLARVKASQAKDAGELTRVRPPTETERKPARQQTRPSRGVEHD